MFASARQKHAASAIPNSATVEESCQLSGRGCPATKRSAGSTRSERASRAGSWSNGSASAFSTATADTASYCRDGDLVNCTNQGYTGVQQDGGYAEMMIAKASGLTKMPCRTTSPRLMRRPCLCAGLTTFSALRNAPARAGDLVAVFGVGGLGHLGVQYARHMGFEVVAIDRGRRPRQSSRKSWARITI